MAVQHSDEPARLTYPASDIAPFHVEVPVAPAYLSSIRKRLLDIAIGSVGVLLLAVVFPFVALAIKLNSPGPVFYRQRRMGRNGEPFELVKFRTMTVDAERAHGAVWARPNDPRVTTVGRYLRKLYIDEFPQWWNVLAGHMSVVGPRPKRPELIGQILGFVPNFNRRLLAKPGITGLAQVNYRYTSTMMEARNKLRHDVLYINAASLWLDIRLIMQTLRRVTMFKGM